MKKGTIALVLILLVAAFLRLYLLDIVPHGLYIDEAGISVNANSILKTGKDEYGIPHPLYFRSFNDYKTPGFIYLTAGTFALLGQSDFSVRFTSAFLGILTVLVFFLIIKKAIAIDKFGFDQIRYLPYVGAFLLAISSWHIQFSRGGFEANAALFLYLLASYLALLYWDKKKLRFLFVSMFFFAVAPYTYHAYRFISPLTVLLILPYFAKHIKHMRMKILGAFCIFLLLSAPLMLTSFSKVGSARLINNSTFAEHPAHTLTDKIIIYPMVYLKNYISFYSYEFLINNGDGNGRHQIHGMGLLYKWELPFLILGFIWLLRQKKSILKKITLLFLLVAPIIASATVPSPHSLRALLLVIPMTTFIACGFLTFYLWLKHFRKTIFATVFLVALFETTMYFHMYYVHYPIVNALDWGSAYKETVYKTKEYKGQYDKIIIDKTFGAVAIYYKLYGPELDVQIVEPGWKKPANLKDKKVLFVRPYYGETTDKSMIDQVVMPGFSKPVFSQFWEL